MSNTQLSRRVASIGLIGAVLLVGSLAWLATTARAQTASSRQPQLTATITNTPFNCPVPTQALVYVDLVTSPTNLLTQVVTVSLHNGDVVTITAESGTFVMTGTDFFQVPVALFANTTHHLNVAAHVRALNQGGCIYGNYTVFANTDENGAPLTIVQEFSGPFVYLPLVVRPANPALSAVVP